MVIDAKDAITDGLHLEPLIAKRLVLLNSKVEHLRGTSQQGLEYSANQ
jgi:hypothetical protein